MLHYIIQTITFQLFFLLIYDVFLKKETFFNWNRLYLIATPILAIILPLIKVESLEKMVPKQYIISLPEIVLGQAVLSENYPTILDQVTVSNAMPYWEMVLYVGVISAAILFLYKLTKIIVLIFKNPKTNSGKLTIVKLLKSNAAFSFFQYVFLGEYLEEEEKEAILKHEIIHVKHKHSIDLLFFEMLRILFWFNPFVYMYQNRITTLHEFIADAEAVKHENKNQYYQSLLAQVFETKNISFINPFFKQSLIKKRIIMLQKSKSNQFNLFKYALLIPLIFGMLIYTSCEKQNETNSDDELDLSEYTYVINTASLQTYDLDNAYEFELAVERAKASRKKQENFLKSNIGYDIWVDDNIEAHKFTYSLQHESEKIPDDYSLLHAIDKDGLKYKMYGRNRFLIKGEKTDQIGIEVPFSAVEQVPVFPGCEDLSNEEQRQCMSDNISKHVNKNFNAKLANKLNLKGKQRINVIFKINTEGEVVGVRSRAPHPDLEAEAIRVIKTLPKMIPGEQKGKKVNVPYSLPIVFQVAD